MLDKVEQKIVKIEGRMHEIDRKFEAMEKKMQGQLAD